MNRYTLVTATVAVLLAVSAAQPATEEARAGTSGALTDVRFGDHASHERAVLDFEGSKAPEFAAREHRDGNTVVRVRLPESKSAEVTDGKLPGDVVSHYTVVRAKSGSLFVDLHLKDAAGSVEVFGLDRPGRVVVDVTPGDGQLRPAPERADNTYVMSPRAGSGVGPGEFRVSGYGRPFEATGAWRVKGPGGKVVSRGNYTTTDWAEAWGVYGFRAAYPERLGGQRGTLEVGQHSARDGSFEGVAVPVKFR